jgi:hypothetical protein
LSRTCHPTLLCLAVLAFTCRCVAPTLRLPKAFFGPSASTPYYFTGGDRHFPFTSATNRFGDLLAETMMPRSQPSNLSLSHPLMTGDNTIMHP